MPLFTALLAPFALLLFPLGGQGADVAAEVTVNDAAPTSRPFTGSSSRVPDWLSLSDMHEAQNGAQVRVEGRVILRIAPRPTPSRNDLLREFEPEPLRMVECPVKRCLAMREIVGASDRGDRLMLFLRDNRILVAQLEKACSPRDFYRGFYLEKNEDGMMCAGRDRLMSRAGAKCQLRELRELVQVSERR